MVMRKINMHYEKSRNEKKRSMENPSNSSTPRELAISGLEMVTKR